jgi:hypothetical protein
MRASSIVWSVSRDLTYELVRALDHEWRAIWRQSDVRRVAKKVSGYMVALIAISLAINVVVSAPWHDSGNRYPGHEVVNGLHVAVPENLRGFAIEQLIPLP